MTSTNTGMYQPILVDFTYTKKQRIERCFFCVGMTGFEPATTRPPDVYSTGLSYIPNSECLLLHTFRDCKITKKNGNSKILLTISIFFFYLIKVSHMVKCYRVAIFF